MINKPLEQTTPFDIIHNFPVPGKFHFRYRANITLGGSTSIIWMDTNDLNTPAPLFKGNIVIKALEYPPYV